VEKEVPKPHVDTSHRRAAASPASHTSLRISPATPILRSVFSQCGGVLRVASRVRLVHPDYLILLYTDDMFIRLSFFLIAGYSGMQIT
jgi:hypothetical protein